MKKQLLIGLGLLLLVYSASGQSKIKDGTVANGGNLPNKDAILELESSGKGLLHARVALTGTANSFPLSIHVAGMMVYNTATAGDVIPGIYYNNGVKWILASAEGSGLKIQNLTGTGTPGLPGQAGGPVLGTNIVFNDSGKWLLNSVTGTWTEWKEAGNVKYDAGNQSFTYADAAGNTQSLTLVDLVKAGVTNSLTQNQDAQLVSNVSGQIQTLTVNLSGDVTGNLGTTTIAAGAVTTAKLADGNVTTAKIAPAAVQLSNMGTSGASDANKVYSTDASGNPVLVAATVLAAAGTSNSLGLANNTLTSIVNGQTATSPAVSGVDLTVNNGTLTSTVNGVVDATPVDVLATASSGLTSSNGNVVLGGTLDNSTVLTTSATKTLTIAGLSGTGAATDKIVVTDATTGVLKAISAGVLTQEPWYDVATSSGSTSNTAAMYSSGWVGVGTNVKSTDVPNEMLKVAGTICTAYGTFADYVFEDYFKGKSLINERYKFKKLAEVDAFIQKNHHLPGVTSIKKLERTAAGYSFNLSELSIQILEKTEELYLHVIAQQKQLDAKDAEVQALKERLVRLEKIVLNKK